MIRPKTKRLVDGCDPQDLSAARFVPRILKKLLPIESLVIKCSCEAS